MAKCELLHHIIQVPYYNNTAYSGGLTQTGVVQECKTHGWQMQNRPTMTSEMHSDMCPIGRIEDATEKAIAAIQAERAKPWP